MGITATGASGARYVYNANPMNSDWHDVPANYMFAYLGLQLEGPVRRTVRLCQRSPAAT
jgi:hypothetical protein